MKAQIIVGLIALSLATVTAPPARPAALNINDTVADPNVRFSENDFEFGFNLNGTQVQLGLGNPASQLVSEVGTLFSGVAETTFSGSWILLSPITPESETIFFTEPGTTDISDVLNFTYSSPTGSIGRIAGFVISDNDAFPLNLPPDIRATETVAETNSPFVFDNTNITASFQSDVPELSTWGMMIVGFAGLGFAAFRQKTKARLAVG